MQIIIEGELTDLNTYIQAERSHRSKGAAIKREETHRVACEAMFAKATAWAGDYPVMIEYEWYSKDARKDIDNVAFAKKFINDGLVDAGVLAGDGRKHITSFRETFHIDKRFPRVVVTIHALSTIE